ncbi:MAG TPA: carbohydrate ABC transporter permease [Acidimicrobiales bacterium]|nr:carbohydrate ABC transporter permease [Acidimicrobiales bacterium]
MAQTLSLDRSDTTVRQEAGARQRRRGPATSRKAPWGWNLLAIVVGILFLVPFVWLVLTAFTNNGTLGVSLSGGLTASNFSSLFASNSASEAIGEGVGGALMNSLYLSGGTMVVTTVVAVLTAYPLSRFRIPGSNILVLAIVFVTGLPIVAVVIPTYDIFVSLNFINSLLWTVLFMAATSLPFAVWIAKNFIDNVPIELEEAAATDGAGTFRTLRHITAPLSIPGLLVIALFTFIQSWSNFFVPFVLLQTPKLPASVTIYQFFGEHTINYSGLCAFALIFTAVPVALYVLLSRRTGGTSLFTGAVKG